MGEPAGPAGPAIQFNSSMLYMWYIQDVLEQQALVLGLGERDLAHLCQTLRLFEPRLQRREPLRRSTAAGVAAVVGRTAARTVACEQDLASGDANLPVTRGGASEAEEALDELEAEILSQLSPAGLAGGGSDDT